MNTNDCKLNVCLDLDNTLIQALEPSDRKKIPSELSSKFRYVDYIPFFRIYERPHLQRFLDYIFEHFNVSVITAAEKQYGLFIIENFILTKPERKLSFVFYRYHVDLSREIYSGVKDLRMLWELFKIPGFYKHNTVIIDDLDMVYQTNPNNTIRIPGFFIVDEETNKVNYDMVNDDELLNVMHQLEFLKENYQTHHCRWIDAALLDFKKKEKVSKNWINQTEGNAPPLVVPGTNFPVTEPEPIPENSPVQEDEYHLSDVEPSDNERSDNEKFEVEPSDNERPDNNKSEVEPSDNERSDNDKSEVEPSDNEKLKDSEDEVEKSLKRLENDTPDSRKPEPVSETEDDGYLR
jgi:hypothetical protein